MKRWIPLVALAFAACASVPRADGERFVVVQVTNDQFYDASVWINNARRGMVNGFSKLTILLPESALTDGGKCATAGFRIIADHSYRGTEKVCISDPREHFTLQLDNMGHAWFTPWRSRR
jgi:hypothetical protein